MFHDLSFAVGKLESSVVRWIISVLCMLGPMGAKYGHYWHDRRTGAVYAFFLPDYWTLHDDAMLDVSIAISGHRAVESLYLSDMRCEGVQSAVACLNVGVLEEEAMLDG